jgi:ribulose-phosphate 3-epimerase
MKLSASILNIKEPKREEVGKLSKLNIDYIHVDVMDGIFVENTTYSYEEFKEILSLSDKPKDVHLMVSDVKKNIDLYANLNPEFITFHYEAISEVGSVINYLKSKNIKVGLSIKPGTDVSEITSFLPYVDLVLVMSVEPGKGGQEYIENSTNKINKLKELREKNNYNYLIEVDGGINDITKEKAKNADILVVGSFITKGDYKEQIKKIQG